MQPHRNKLMKMVGGGEKLTFGYEAAIDDQNTVRDSVSNFILAPESSLSVKSSVWPSSLSSGMHVTGAVKKALTSREVRLWKSGKYLLNSPSKASRCWLGNQVLRRSITLL